MTENPFKTKIYSGTENPAHTCAQSSKQVLNNREQTNASKKAKDKIPPKGIRKEDLVKKKPKRKSSVMEFIDPNDPDDLYQDPPKKRKRNPESYTSKYVPQPTYANGTPLISRWGQKQGTFIRR